jgi:hypothetical protein
MKISVLLPVDPNLKMFGLWSGNVQSRFLNKSNVVYFTTIETIQTKRRTADRLELHTSINQPMGEKELSPTSEKKTVNIHHIKNRAGRRKVVVISAYK